MESDTFSVKLAHHSRAAVILITGAVASLVTMRVSSVNGGHQPCAANTLSIALSHFTRKKI